ncbi:MAG: transcriptional repressor NrdR [Selenomonadales bacterium]|nr:transcriptional repressor NrdR [Selenomonadales bacterium]MBQ2114701.1 transcriptional repressor NrdR [Selenomonadales bacterium]MBQ2247015.1 transcriptional repressor NrdR [Selenomonadales bacterium]MBQ5588348.1 transcriptional repressor NrdR [Selenomonadales bacterium]MBQ5636799.1 transcriptional repressor NrdR [Selenomonadales bacterium]
MRCPACNYVESKVIDSRATEDNSTIRRRRECHQCGTRFTTFEMVEKVPLMVRKKDGRRVVFEREKVLNGLMKACEKRPVSVEQMEEVATEVEKELRGSQQREVSSQEIGECIMRHLLNVDQVAYVRFASVYRQFADIESFKEALESLIQNKKPL